MNADWQDFLRAAGAAIDDDTVSFDETAALNAADGGTLLADLSSLGIIRVTGEEARDFLQNQFSSDVREVNDSRSQISSYCTAKGRILAIFRIVQQDDALLLILPRATLDNTLKRLRMFVLRSKVELTDASDEQVLLGLAGTAAPDLVRATCGAVPAGVDDVIHGGGARVVRLHGETPRFLVLAGPDTAPDLWQSWVAGDGGATPGGETAWRLLTIRAGEPAIAPETMESFVPQMMNLEILGGVSFRKGCYPGQEIVARTHYLGKLKRRMFLTHSETPDAIAPGTAVYVAGGNQAIGEVVQAAPAPTGGQELTAVLRLDNRDDALRLGGPDGPALVVNDPPYDLTLSE